VIFAFPTISEAGGLRSIAFFERLRWQWLPCSIPASIVNPHCNRHDLVNFAEFLKPGIQLHVSRTYPEEDFIMEKYALLAQVQAKPGQEQVVEEFLKSALPLAQAEPGTIRWYAFKTGPDTFGIFDTFAVEAARDAHLNGEIAKALMANADALLAVAPKIEKLDILVTK